MLDPKQRLSETMTLAEAEGQKELVRVLSATSLLLPDIARVLAASARARHSAATETGAAVTRAILHLRPESDLDLRISQAVADILAPLSERH